MPKKKSLPPERLTEAIISAKNEILLDNYTIQPPSHNVWIKIAKSLENAYNAKSIYIFL